MWVGFAYCTVYRARDQRQGNLDLPSTPGIFVGVGETPAKDTQTKGTGNDDSNSTRQHLSFDPQLFPLRLKPTALSFDIIVTQAPASSTDSLSPKKLKVPRTRPKH
jgi:hypothetical protein